MKDSFRIYVDRDCPLCVQLGHFAKKFAGQDIEIATWQVDHPRGLAGEVAIELVATDGDQEWHGAEAWREILLRYPGLKKIGWIAERLGLADQMGQVFVRAGHGLRRVCWGCPSRLSRRS